MHWRRKWQPTPVFLPGESQGPGSLVGCHLWGCTPLRGLEGVPGLPGAPQDEAGLTRKFETSHVGGARGRGRLMGFLRLLRPWGFSHEARRGSQGASRAAPGKSGLHARGEGERVLALQSCPTLCDPIDGSPPGSPVPGILQARTLEWVAISFSNA